MNRFAKFAWGVLIYNLPVIVWGAYVRIAKAGNGCGEHWPDCNGQFIPPAPGLKTLIEFSHRLSTGLDGILVLLLAIWALLVFPKRHVVRWCAALSLLFTIFEALIGAVLVKKGLVAENDSIARAVVISLHLVNTFLLLAFLALTAWWASTSKEIGWPLHLSANLKQAILLGACLVGIIFLSASGAVTALGTTLFPVTSMAEGMARDLAPKHFLESLIWVHPVAAILLGLTIIFCVVVLSFSHHTRQVALLSKFQLALFVTQIILGGINLLLHAPVWMQLLHLFVANLVWVNLVLFSACLLSNVKARQTIITEEKFVAARAARTDDEPLSR